MKLMTLVSVLIVSVLIQFPQNVYCQSTAQRPHVELLRIVGGPSIVNIRDYTPTTQSQHAVSEIGYGLGIELLLRVQRKLSLVGRLTYEKKGGRYLADIQVADPISNQYVTIKDGFETKDVYECFSLPITIRYFLGSTSRYWIEGGFYFSLKSRVTILSSSAVANYRTSIDYSDFVRNEDFGLCLGVGRSFRVWKLDNLSFCIFSAVGLRNVLNVDAIWKTNALTFQVGVPFMSRIQQI